MVFNLFIIVYMFDYEKWLQINNINVKLKENCKIFIIIRVNYLLNSI